MCCRVPFVFPFNFMMRFKFPLVKAKYSRPANQHKHTHTHWQRGSVWMTKRKALRNFRIACCTVFFFSRHSAFSRQAAAPHLQKMRTKMAKLTQFWHVDVVWWFALSIDANELCACVCATILWKYFQLKISRKSTTLICISANEERERKESCKMHVSGWTTFYELNDCHTQKSLLARQRSNSMHT